jgi:hypothetical protein
MVLEHHAEAGSHERLVVSDQDADAQMFSLVFGLPLSFGALLCGLALW